jgi:hypothetical protein
VEVKYTALKMFMLAFDAEPDIPVIFADACIGEKCQISKQPMTYQREPILATITRPVDDVLVLF